MSYAQHFSTRSTPQTDKARREQKQNNAGGYTFVLDKWARLDRWLILGCEGGSYYASERAMTRDNAQTVVECLTEDGPRTVARIVEISDAGRAPKNDPAIFALAIASGHESPQTRAAALAALPKVCRIGTHLFHFARDAQNFRKWGRGLRRAVAAWYNEKPVTQVAYQALKYQQRDGWSHRDLLRLAHPKAPSPEHDALYRYIVGGVDAIGAERKRGKPLSADSLPAVVLGFERLKAAESAKEVVALIREHRFTHEMLDTKWKNDADVWETLLERMPLTALVRNLAKMTAVGLLKPMSAASKKVQDVLASESNIGASRLHPIAILSALKVYEQGHGEKGSLTWSPVRDVVDALNDAFYLAFDTIEPTGKNHLLALDVSGSMGGGTIAGCPGLTPRVASAAMAMVTARAEKNWHVMGFSTRFIPLPVSPKQRLDDVVRAISNLPFAGTDCALPMLYAAGEEIGVDTFVVYTDNETWAGHIHPFQALQAYRAKMNKPKAKLIVVGMTSTEFTIADPSDAGMMDVVGFDTAAPAVMADFARN